MRKTAVFRDNLFLEHDPGVYHVESPKRLKIIYDELDRPEIGGGFFYPSFAAAEPEQLQLNHTASYIEKVAATAGKPFVSLDPDTRTSARSYEAACLAAGAVNTGVDLLLSNEVDNCFALVRPPGHHAESDRAQGFCLFNNVAVAARHAIQQHKLERVFIFDWDLHHGNGTQHSFYDTDQVLYCSTHQFPYYPGTGSLVEWGAGRGEGLTVNIPLSGGQDDQAFGRIVNEIVAPVALQYRPELIIVSAGFDIYVGDPLGTMAVTARGFAYMTRVLLGLADELCAGRLLFALEGGYHLQGLRDGVVAVLNELAGNSILTAETIWTMETTKVRVPDLDHARNIAKKHWTL